MTGILLILYTLPALWLLSRAGELEDFLTYFMNNDERKSRVLSMRASMALIIIFWPLFAAVDIVVYFFWGDK